MSRSRTDKNVKHSRLQTKNDSVYKLNIILVYKLKIIPLIVYELKIILVYKL